MKIGMMTAWNQDAEPAIHAELVSVSPPVVTSNTEFVWFLDKEVLKYSSKGEFMKLFDELLRGEVV